MNSFTTPTLPLLPPSRFKRWLATISAVLLTTLGFTAIAPAAQAAPSEVTATVFDTPDVRYVNVRNGAGTEYTKIGQVNAGASVTLECYSYGSQVQGPYGATNLWYKLKGYDNGWVNDGYIYTGSDEPVTGKCEAAAPTSTEQPYPVSGTRIVDDGQVWLQLFGHFYDNSGRPLSSIGLSSPTTSNLSRISMITLRSAGLMGTCRTTWREIVPRLTGRRSTPLSVSANLPCIAPRKGASGSRIDTTSTRTSTGCSTLRRRSTLSLAQQSRSTFARRDVLTTPV